MLNLSLSEESMIRTLRDVETPPPSPNLVSRLISKQLRQSNAVLWLMPVTLGSGIALAMVLALLVPPTPSWAEVIRAVDDHTQYTLTLTRIMNGGKERDTYYAYRDGDLWQHGTTYGLADRTVVLRQHPPVMNYVLIDSRKAPPDVAFSAERILRQGAVPTVERNVEWNARRVDIFRIKTTYRAGRVETLEQEVIVDPETALPIQVTTMRDNNQWGDICEYDYSKPDPSVFRPAIRKDAKVYDLVKQRKELLARLASKQPETLIVDDERVDLLVVPGDATAPRIFHKVHLKIEGIKGIVRAVEMPIDLPGKPRSMGSSLMLDGRPWRFLEIRAGQFPGSSQLDLSAQTKALSGTATIGNETISFKNAEVLRTGDARYLIKSFGSAGESGAP